mgnify:CR=1 FL=1
MPVIPKPIPARMKGVNRAEICDVNFIEFVRDWSGHADAAPSPRIWSTSSASVSQSSIRGCM